MVKIPPQYTKNSPTSPTRHEAEKSTLSQRGKHAVFPTHSSVSRLVPCSGSADEKCTTQLLPAPNSTRGNKNVCPPSVFAGCCVFVCVQAGGRCYVCFCAYSSKERSLRPIPLRSVFSSLHAKNVEKCLDHVVQSRWQRRYFCLCFMFFYHKTATSIYRRVERDAHEAAPRVFLLICGWIHPFVCSGAHTPWVGGSPPIAIATYVHTSLRLA